jgi:NADPH-dependent 2,4-dienoyl-CoA reductase/sulfur reductase-like enzyme
VEQHDLIILGGGPAGMAAAYGAYQAGIKDILILERDDTLGGILNQCIHNGFGLHRFKEELTGPEYAARYEDFLADTSVEVRSRTMAIDLTADHVITAVSEEKGVQLLKGKAIILAMGCRERPRGAIATPGDRVAGIYTAGAAQKYCNIDGYLVGKRIVILGSGDIGLIMARRMTLEGAKVLADVELCPYSNGLARNIAQCLNDFDIPLYLSHTVTDIKADAEGHRVSSVTIMKVDEKRQPIPGTEMVFDCDTLLLSVGLIPENELSKKAGIELDRRTRGPLVQDNLETGVPGIFACGNVLQVHDLVDNVSHEGEKAGKNAARYLLEGEKAGPLVKMMPGNGIGYICPQFIRQDTPEDVTEIFFRVREPKRNVKFVLKKNGQAFYSLPKLRIAPSEMESLKIKKEMLQDASEITLDVEEAIQ